MARNTQQVPEQTNETVAEKAAMSQSIQENPQFEMTDSIKEMIARQVADGIASALPAVMAAMQNKTDTAVYANGPSPVVQATIAPTAEHKQNFLKHYRLDDTVSGKYQMIDVKKMREQDLSIGESIIKGAWVHFASDHFYATTEKEVAFVDYLIETGVPIYEDHSASSTAIRCFVQGCGRIFGDEATLQAHMKATHGVTSPNA